MAHACNVNTKEAKVLPQVQDKPELYSVFQATRPCLTKKQNKQPNQETSTLPKAHTEKTNGLAVYFQRKEVG